MINVVLYEPEIPQNTGNIMRSCKAFNCRLHLIEPLGFHLDERHLRRAGMDYMKTLDYKIYQNFETFLKENGKGQFVFFPVMALRDSIDASSIRKRKIYISSSARNRPEYQKPS